MNIDTEKLRRAVYDFQFHGGPSNSTGSDPATIKDVKDVVNGIAELLYEFINELESAD